MSKTIIDKHEQHRLDQLGEYPFARLRQLLQGLIPNPDLPFIDAGAGEPRLPLPSFVQPTLDKHLAGFSKYPTTTGNDFLRESIAAWLQRRFGLKSIDANSQVLSANGTREALFAAAHALINPNADSQPWVMMPNPMYQIYLGAAITAGGKPYLQPCSKETGFAPDIEGITDDVWQDTALVYVCSPSNPTGWVADEVYYTKLLKLAEKFDFYVLADECYSEIYYADKPIGLLEVAQNMGNTDYKRCLVMNSLSKRSALPGLRSGLIAGDAALIKQFSKLRSYTGPGTPLPLQHVAAAAWADEEHVQDHLKVYRDSLDAFFDVYGGTIPAGSFFVWLPVADEEDFVKKAYVEQGVKLLPGSYLGTEDQQGINAGSGYVRAALVDGVGCASELAKRLKALFG
ncbi:aminotransferase class I/II-fold pyridoxal phosphate-dependent enzyme [Ghiorsea bivora]|uniref:aminotransferase class I/II-fold pyridoxal phosphate-dependent enzyme n=1 Tax=Ghiorsea bivora TaxID=1485545 RepID=UPI0005701972|nr:aminotransferase class I/II-fold pyridoxal phosphate-dependent enzyme [Ghiorsea bivora]